MLNFLLAYAAGVVTILSPCVLPLIPIVLGGALTAHRYGPWALAAGLVLAFTGFGLLVATVGYSIGLTPQRLNMVAALIMISFGLILMIEPLQARFAMVANAATGALNTRVARFAPEGLGGQFALGAVLGAVWTPCVGPTLGAAIALAATGEALPYAATVMAMFALGTATPLLAIMLVSQHKLNSRRGQLSELTARIKPILGLLLITVGVLFLSGWMSKWEAFLLAHSPAWLSAFIYGF